MFNLHPLSSGPIPWFIIHRFLIYGVINLRHFHIDFFCIETCFFSDFKYHHQFFVKHFSIKNVETLFSQNKDTPDFEEIFFFINKT